MPVTISGVDNALRALTSFQPKAAKKVRIEVREASKPVITAARGFAPAQAPLSGWSKPVGMWKKRSYNAMTVRGGIGFDDMPTKKNRSGFAYTAYIYNKSAAGAIYETAGRKNPNGKKQAPTVQHYANAGTPYARPDYKMRNSSKRYSQSANPNAGKQFIDSMGPIYKEPRANGQTGRRNRKHDGRLIYRAWAEDQGKVLGSVAKAYNKVIADFNAGKL